MLTFGQVLLHLQGGEAVTIRVRAGGSWISLEVHGDRVAISSEVPRASLEPEFVAARVLLSLLASARDLAGSAPGQ